MTAIRAAVTYGLDADAYLVAVAVNRALEGLGIRVMVEQAGDETEIWIVRNGQPISEATRFEPGQRVIVTYDEGWHVEAVPAVAA